MANITIEDIVKEFNQRSEADLKIFVERLDEINAEYILKLQIRLKEIVDGFEKRINNPEVQQRTSKQ